MTAFCALGALFTHATWHSTSTTCRTLAHLQRHHRCSQASLLQVKGKGHAMLGPVKGEVDRCMQFWASTLRMAAPEGSVELRPQ